MYLPFCPLMCFISWASRALTVESRYFEVLRKSGVKASSADGEVSSCPRTLPEAEQLCKTSPWAGQSSSEPLSSSHA